MPRAMSEVRPTGRRAAGDDVDRPGCPDGIRRIEIAGRRWVRARPEAERHIVDPPGKGVTRQPGNHGDAGDNGIILLFMMELYC